MNWLGDSEPNFPAQISGFLYAQFYATLVKGTRVSAFSPSASALQLGNYHLGHAAAARLRIAADFLRRLYDLRCLGTVSPFSKHPPS